MIFTTSISVVKGLLNVLIAFIVSVYMVSDKKLLARGFKRVLYSVASEKAGDVMMETLRECYHIFSQFVLGKTVDSFIIGWICFFLMTILRLPFTPIVSLIVGITNMIPYFGPFIGAVPGIVLILMVDPIQAIIFTVLIIVIQQFDGLYLGPRILGETVGLRPLWIIFAITLYKNSPRTQLLSSHLFHRFFLNFIICIFDRLFLHRLTERINIIICNA